MDIPRGIGYVIAILIIILGIVVLPYGIVLVFAAGPDDMGCVYRWEEKKSQGFSEDRTREPETQVRPNESLSASNESLLFPLVPII